MRETLLYSLLELANATSQNLGFAHQDDVDISYGEETITETNLLELRRRHPTKIRLRTFGKKQESVNGADWEWHVIGRNRKLRMRVQAKRLQKDDKLKIPHKVRSSGNRQIDLLIADAKKYGLKPIYCLYASENQRNIWKKGTSSNGSEEFEYGCLLANARKVNAKQPKTLSDIEAECVPWHYLVDRQRYSGLKLPILDEGAALSFLIARETPLLQKIDEWNMSIAEFPTISELNAVDGPAIALEGVIENKSPTYEQQMTGGADFEMPNDAYRERGIRGLIEIDVKDITPRRKLGG